MPMPYASIPSASLKLACFPVEVPAGRTAIFSLAKENIPTLGSPKMSDSITGTTLSLARKDYDSPLFVFHDSDSDFPGRLAYSSLPEHTVRLLTQRHLGCLHPLSHELAQESDGSRSPLLSWSIPYSSEIKVIEFFFDDLQLLFLRLFRFSRGFRRFWNFNFLLGFLGDLFRLFFDLLFHRRHFFRLLDQRIVFLWFLLFARERLHLDLSLSPVSLLGGSSNFSRSLCYDP